MKVIRRQFSEEEVEAPDDLLTLQQAVNEFGGDVKRLSDAVQRGLLPAYIVEARNPRHGRVRVRRADMQEYVKPIFADGQEE